MESALQVTAAAAFGFYVLLDGFSAMPRFSGAITGQTAMGYTASVMVNTLKRALFVLLPPLLGAIAHLGGMAALGGAILLSYLAAAGAMLAVIFARDAGSAFFCQFVVSLSQGAGALAASGKALRGHRQWLGAVRTALADSGEGKILWPIVARCGLVYFFFAGSAFTLNLIGARFPQYGTIIYQLIGALTGLGTIIHSFSLDPILTRRYDRGEGLGTTLNSVVLGLVLSLVLGGLFHLGLYMALVR